MLFHSCIVFVTKIMKGSCVILIVSSVNVHYEVLFPLVSFGKNRKLSVTLIAMVSTVLRTTSVRT